MDKKQNKIKIYRTINREVVSKCERERRRVN